MDIDALTAGLHSPMIAWNTNKCQIVERMTENECFAIAKRTTHSLRDRSPEIRRYMESASRNRQKFAKLLFTQEIAKSDLLSEKDVIQFKRMARVVDAQKKHQKSTVEFFQNEAGYRACCLAYMAGENSFQDSNPLLHEMESLATQQETFNKAILLSDLLGVMIKRASKYPDYDAEAQKKKYVEVLVDYTAKVRTTLEGCSLHRTDQCVSEYLENLHAKQPQIADNTHAAMLSFALIKDCFELINNEIVQKLTVITAPMIGEYPELRLQAV